MTALAPNLFERRFQNLIEIGRARLPWLAPEWTDHNAHDPGITLMELLAWTAEAQLYSLSRVRRDERVAYAALLGLTSAGTQGAQGLIWPDRLDPDSPFATFSKTVVIGADAAITVAGSDTPTFRLSRPLLWVPGRVDRLVTKHAHRPEIDLTRTNERGGIAYLPFGERGGPRDVLALTFTARDDAGFFGANRDRAAGAVWSIGVIAAPPVGGASGDKALGAARRSSLEATVVVDDERTRVKVVSDSTYGLLTTGVILLDLGGMTSNPHQMTLELRSPMGFPRPPRVLRIEPNVLPIQQGHTIVRETHEAQGTPDWTFTLETSGLRFTVREEAIKIEVEEPDGLSKWRRVDRLSDYGPAERAFELNVAAGEVTFGNGVNGRIPPALSRVLADYSVSDAEQGDIARNRKWRVTGFAGVFGNNPDPISGGAAPAGWIEQRRDARQRSRIDHALVSQSDIIEAAKELPLVEVARAWVVTPDKTTPRTGTITLIVMRSRVDEREPEQTPETARWLDAIRRRLLPRMPLGARLLVRAPRYRDFSLRVTLEAAQGRDPEKVREAVIASLRKRLALVDRTGGFPRQPGVPLSRRDLWAWIRATDAVKRVIDVQLMGADGKAVPELHVPRSGLPRWLETRSDIRVQREAGRPQ